MKDDYPKRGEIYWVRLDPTDGKEINKIRPCLVISSDLANQSELIVVVPITSNVKKVLSKIEVKIDLKGQAGKIISRQMRSIDRTKRLGKKIGCLSSEEMKQVDETLRVILNF